MKPQPMSDAEIAEVERDSFIGVGRPTAGFDRDRFARAIEARVNAQWAAMIGEPVAWIEHHKAGDNLNWDEVNHPYAKASPLYAIKETQ